MSKEASQDDLRQELERYRLAFRASGEGLFEWDLTTDVLFCSERFTQILDRPEPPATMAELLSQVPRAHRERVRGELRDHLTSGDGTVQLSFPLSSNGPGYVWVRFAAVISSTEDDGPPSRLVGSIADITERKRSEEELWRAAHFDSTTGLPNRRLLMMRLRELLEKDRERLSVIAAEIDRFSTISDRFGRPAAGEAEASFGEKLLSLLPPAAIAARVAPGEFAVAVPDLGRSQIIQLASRLRDRLRGPVFFSGNHRSAPEVSATTSLGVAMAEHDSSAADLLRHAELALHAEEGTARMKVFHADMRRRVQATAAIEAQLPRALEQGQFEVWFQPIVHLDGSGLAGFEALTRWRDPERGLVGPDRFIPVAEENGFITSLGRWVLREALKALRSIRSLPGAEDLYVAVNVSGRQLERAGLARDVLRALAGARLPPSALKLELTETALLRNAEIAAKELISARETGIRVALDDFGTGHSSLSLLQRFPVDELKIDKSFVQPIQADRPVPPIVRMVLGLAESLDAPCVAEGIEDDEQEDILRQLGCRYGQGYQFAKPRPPEEWTAEQLSAITVRRDEPEDDETRPAIAH